MRRTPHAWSRSIKKSPTVAAIDTFVPRASRFHAGRTVGCLKGGNMLGRENGSMNFTVPLIIMVLVIGISVLIYWGGFAEESRARKG